MNIIPCNLNLPLLAKYRILDGYLFRNLPITCYTYKERVEGAFLTGKTWNIPEYAEKPKRINSKVKAPITLLDILKDQKKSKMSGGIYHKIQINS